MIEDFSIIPEETRDNFRTGFNPFPTSAYRKASLKRAKGVKWNGIEYESLGEMARKHRISRPKVTKHLKEKIPFEGHMIERLQK